MKTPLVPDLLLLIGREGAIQPQTEARPPHHEQADRFRQLHVLADVRHVLDLQIVERVGDLQVGV